MKATGIVRRIDDLGRVVIPKEIRRTMRIREGDPLEIYTDREGEVIFKKYSPIGELATFAAQYAETLQKICSTGVPKKEYMDKKISKELEEATEKRTLYQYRGGERICVTGDDGRHYISSAMPILTEGDVIGCVCAMASTEEGEEGERLPKELEAKLIQTAAVFLGKQLES